MTTRALSRGSPAGHRYGRKRRMALQPALGVVSEDSRGRIELIGRNLGPGTQAWRQRRLEMRIICIMISLKGPSSPAQSGRGKIRRITCIMPSLVFTSPLLGGWSDRPLERPDGATIDTGNPLERHNGVIWPA